MSNITLGPWRIVLGDAATYRYHERRLILGGPEGLTTIAKLPEGMDGEAEANARLIAAAPDLLEALKRAAEVLDAEGIVYGNCDDEPLDVLSAARDAIAKAGGQ